MADSTLGLPPEEALAHGIHLVPQQVVHGGRSFRDLWEISPEEVLALLERGERLTTSQVAPEDLRETYERLLATHSRVVSVHVSGKLSGTVATAWGVARAFGDRVKVLDSWSLNGGFGWSWRRPGGFFGRGWPGRGWRRPSPPTAKGCGDTCSPGPSPTSTARGASGAWPASWGLLRILPILTFQEGRVEAGPKVRGFGEGLRRVAELFRQEFPEGGLVYLAHAGNPQGAEALKEGVQAEGVEILATLQAGAAVSVHAGPGTVALFAGPRR